MRIYRRRFIFANLLVMMVYCSCSKSHPIVNVAEPSLLEYIAKEPSLSLLDTAIGIVSLDTAMSSGGPYTFFAPSDSAFLAVGLTADSLRRMDHVQLLHLLEYNVVQGRVSSAALPGFLKQQFTSLNLQYSPFITKNYYGVFLNGISVTKGDIEVGDGVVQVTSRVAVPPPGSQLDAMEREPDLHFMVALARNVQVFGAMVSDPNPTNGWQGTGNFQEGLVRFGNTLFAPTDSAFMAYGYADTTSLINDSVSLVVGGYTNTGYIVPILSAYIFNGFQFTSDFMGQVQVGGLSSSLDGSSFTGTGIAKGSPVLILKPNIIATNGVVQKINQVFLQ